MKAAYSLREERHTSGRGVGTRLVVTLVEPPRRDAEGRAPSVAVYYRDVVMKDKAEQEALRQLARQLEETPEKMEWEKRDG